MSRRKEKWKYHFKFPIQNNNDESQMDAAYGSCAICDVCSFALTQSMWMRKFQKNWNVSQLQNIGLKGLFVLRKDKISIFSDADAHSPELHKPWCYGNSIINFFYFNFIIIVIIWILSWHVHLSWFRIFVRFSQGVDNEDWVCPLIWILLIAIPHAYRLALHIHDCRLYSTFDT